MKKDEYWEASLEDSLDLTYKLPIVAAYIYRLKYFGVPVMLGRSGIKKIVEYKLDDDELAMFNKSAASVKETHEALKNVVEL